MSLLLALAAAAAPPDPPAAASPVEIIAQAPAGEWQAIAPADLLVMDLSPDASGAARRVVIQLIPPPFSQGWIGNIRKLAAAHWWDGLSINRVQDNYVAQWGDAEGEDPVRARPLPGNLLTVPESCYAISFGDEACSFEEADDTAWQSAALAAQAAAMDAARAAASAAASVSRHRFVDPSVASTRTRDRKNGWHERDSIARWVEFYEGFAVASDNNRRGPRFWPTHCYAMVGVARDLSPNTGSGAELYTVIGHAPRQLDRNIALVGRVIEGIEHLSSLPRGTGAAGFYEKAEERTPIAAVRIGTEAAGLAAYEYLSTESASFARYADARANRRDPFFIVPAGGADICNIAVPVRRVKG